MSGDYLWDRSGPPDPDIVRLERLLSTLEQPHPPAALRVPDVEPRRRMSPAFALVASIAAAAIVALASWTWLARSGAAGGWDVTRVSGAPVLGSRPMADEAILKEGGRLDTKADGRATIAVADIGQVQLEPETSVRLLSASAGDYRLHLERGTMHALIWSPPGQFFVETPSSTAVDLGCAYTMSVDAQGVGVVRVTSGWVGFEWRGREAFIPAGAVCVTRPGRGPGTPHYETTSDAFRAALAVIDTQQGSAADQREALSRLLGEAQKTDTVTLWHLLSRVGADQRDRVFERLAAFVPPPAGVTQEGIRLGDREMLDRWWDALGLGTTNWWRVWKQQWRPTAP